MSWRTGNPIQWGYYLVTIHIGEEPTLKIAYYSLEFGWEFNGVVAWMELPQPYERR